jgi:hypothetical protein
MTRGTSALNLPQIVMVLLLQHVHPPNCVAASERERSAQQGCLLYKNH